MTPSRRSVLAAGASLTALAGCGGLGGSTDGSGGGNSSGTDGSLDLSFGEGAVFTNDEGLEISVTVANPRLRETVPTVRDAEIYVDSPESQAYFFLADVTVVNQGETRFKPPRGLSFETDAGTADIEAIRTPGRKYLDIERLDPGASATGVAAFPAPADGGTATVSLQFQTLVESPPARWSAPYGDVETHTADLSGEGFGDPVTVSKGAYAYEFTPVSARTTGSYTDGDGNETTAPDGSTFLLLRVEAENVGEKAVKLPTPYDVRVDADGSVVRADQYAQAADRYEGRVEPTEPGGSITGVLQYEVPESASAFETKLAVGNQTFATWPIDPDAA